MMDILAALWSDYGVFLLKTMTIVFALVFVIGMVANAAQRQKSSEGELQVDNLTEGLRDTVNDMRLSLASGKAKKQLAKTLKKNKEGKGEPKGRLFVIDFKGSIDAKEVECLRKEVTAILGVADKQDEVLVKLESPGGMVHGYGLAAAQLKRLRDNDLKVTIAVDKVAASGGYMMACVGHEIVSAPFAVVGSIGVIAQIPNFHKVLKKNDIDFEQITAGEYKRTLTMFGENTDKGREKFKEEIEGIHTMFKKFVKENRDSIDIDAVATGEVWYGQEALEKGLVDRIATSDDLLLDAVKTKDVIRVRYKQKVKLGEKIAQQATTAVERSLMKWYQNSRFY
ncbi:MAG: serine protease SohB [Idiomarinaceae bacterium HL-53]|nr:MAG: serine protease SohB [Idiomarinaceae bacterium HL-53]CUS49567.1 inner membrane peptidase. Serine peptidase. MEROPS family S49 [Idiomarinaceae bacterium HL-53]